MINRFTVNGKTYVARPFNFFMVTRLSKLGIPIQKMGDMGEALINAYFAICADVDEEESARLIEKHIINGGDLDDITDAMAKEMNDSDFFRELANRGNKGTKENPTEDTTENPKAKKGRKPEATEE